MAAANPQYITSGQPGGFTNLKMAVGTATMAAGTNTITAAELGLSTIVHLFVFPWGITTVTGLIPGSTTAFAAEGQSSVVIELIEDDGTALDATAVCSLLAFGH